jgi:hypothetical protein
MESMAHATYEDLLRVPQNMVAELIEGEVYASSRPGYRHANAASELLMSDTVAIEIVPDWAC